MYQALFSILEVTTRYQKEPIAIAILEANPLTELVDCLSPTECVPIGIMVSDNQIKRGVPG